MSPIEEQLSGQFYAWESRGRGREIHPMPVALEPPFRPFLGYSLCAASFVDDGRRPTFASSLIERFFGSPKTQEIVPELEEPAPKELNRQPVTELSVFLPANAHFRLDSFQAFLTSLPQLAEPVSFEVFGNSQRIVMQFTAGRQDLGRIKPLLTAHFPSATFQVMPEQLATVWTGSGEKAAIEFGLGREFMLPLATGIPDPLVALSGTLQGLAADELGVYQILLQPVQNRWEDSIVRAVSNQDGKPIFVNAPELVSASERKVSRPLFSVVVRLASNAGDIDRAWEIAANLSGTLRLFQNPQGNELIPLSNEEYPYEDHAEDVLRRQSRRCGMLLNTDELTGFVHLPTVPLPALQIGQTKTKAAPYQPVSPGCIVLGQNKHMGTSLPVILSPEQRFRHLHLLGATGTGKSTLLFNLIRQDIESDQGVAVLDPHGDLIDRILSIIPEHRRGDVIVFDPSDPEFTVGFNLLSAHSEAEKALLASDLVSVFERHSTSWGDQMNSVLRNAVLAILESTRGGTLLDLRRFLLEPDFRMEFLSAVNDTEVLYYWQKAFGQLSGNKSLGPILTRLDTFLSPKPIRHALAIQHAKLDFGKVMDSGKIFLAKLPQGLIGKENSFLLGSLLVGKFQQLAMARQGLPEHQRRPFFLHIDEFHQFITPSMAEILNGARKYRLGLTLAHQELRQLSADKDVESALLSNAGTRIVFRVGDADAKALAEGFSGFDAGDLSKLEKGQAICRIERSDQDFNLSIPASIHPPEDQAALIRESVIARSREQFATPRADIEALLRQQLTVAPKLERAKPAAQPTITEPPPVQVAEQSKAISSETPPAHVIAEETSNKKLHTSLRDRILSEAEALDFSGSIEEFIPGSQQRIDLVLRRGKLSIACEISVSNTIDYELGNISKCLTAGFSHVAMVCLNRRKLENIRMRFSTESFEAPSVGFYTPQELLLQLEHWAIEAFQSEERGEHVIEKQSIKLNDADADITARKQKEREMLNRIALAMKSGSGNPPRG